MTDQNLDEIVDLTAAANGFSGTGGNSVMTERLTDAAREQAVEAEMDRLDAAGAVSDGVNYLERLRAEAEWLIHLREERAMYGPFAS